jgi:hypothetical protein
VKKNRIRVFAVCFVLLVSCQAECPPERISFIDDPEFFASYAVVENSAAGLVEIRGSEVQMDRVITGPVCNDTWQGIVYLTCDIQLPAREDDAFYFQDCDLTIEEGTVVYVEAHNDKGFNQGCSCHE